jgi:hypothetical protein
MQMVGRQLIGGTSAEQQRRTSYFDILLETSFHLYFCNNADLDVHIRDDRLKSTVAKHGRYD